MSNENWLSSFFSGGMKILMTFLGNFYNILKTLYQKFPAIQKKSKSSSFLVAYSLFFHRYRSMKNDIHRQNIPFPPPTHTPDGFPIPPDIDVPPNAHLVQRLPTERFGFNIDSFKTIFLERGQAEKKSSSIWQKKSKRLSINY